MVGASAEFETKDIGAHAAPVIYPESLAGEGGGESMRSLFEILKYSGTPTQLIELAAGAESASTATIAA